MSCWMGTAPILTASISSETALSQRLAWLATAFWRSSSRVVMRAWAASVSCWRPARVVATDWAVWVAWTDTDESTDDTDVRKDTDSWEVVVRRWVASWARSAPTVIWSRRAARDWRSASIGDGGELLAGELAQGGGGGVGLGDHLVELGEEGGEGGGAG